MVSAGVPACENGRSPTLHASAKSAAHRLTGRLSARARPSLACVNALENPVHASTSRRSSGNSTWAIRKAVAYLQQLEALGVRFRSYTEPYLSTENELVSHVLLGVLSYFAEYEAQKISRRTIAGLERARAEGKTLGRPSTFETHRSALEEMLGDGVAKAEMARRTGLAYNTVKGHLRRMETERAEADTPS